MPPAQPFKKLTYDALQSFYANFSEIYPAFYISFQEEFRRLCISIKQKSNFPIAVLDFTLLRTNIARQKYAAEVISYGKEHFFDKDCMTVGEMDISSLFKEYELLSEAVLKESRKYPKELSGYDAQSHMLSVCGDFYKAFTFVMREHMYELSQLQEFKELPFAEEFEVNCGEYAAGTETVYTRNRGKLPEEEIRRLRSGEGCNYKDFTGLNLNSEAYENSDFRFSDFSFGDLNYCCFQYCYFDFSHLREVSAQNAEFHSCVLSGTDFYGADLRNAKFISVTNSAYYGNGKPLLDLEYRLSFRQADLRGAVFKDCDLSNVDFVETDLRNAIFDNDSFRTAKLSDVQRVMIRCT